MERENSKIDNAEVTEFHAAIRVLASMNPLDIKDLLATMSPATIDEVVKKASDKEKKVFQTRDKPVATAPQKNHVVLYHDLIIPRYEFTNNPTNKIIVTSGLCCSNRLSGTIFFILNRGLWQTTLRAISLKK